MADTAVLEARHLTKRYPGVQALDQVDFHLNTGEVRALLGKNGAGKSTLIKIFSGAVAPDEGTLTLDGQPVHFHEPADARRHGIATIYQELSLVPDLSVAENIMLGRWPRRRHFGVSLVDQAGIKTEAMAALKTLGVELPLDTPVSHFSVALQQIVEIAKAISVHPKVLILDEPTSSLPASEVDRLIYLVRRLAWEGMAIIYISHRLREIPLVADSVTVMRDGRIVSTIPVPDISAEAIASMMVGEQWVQHDHVPVATTATTPVALSASHLTRQGKLHDVSFDVHEGEVVGLAGLLGSGRTEIVRSIMGLDALDSGTITINGASVSDRSPRELRARGVGMTPEHRKHDGLVLGMDVEQNLTLAAPQRISHFGLLQGGKERDLAQEIVTKLAIATPSLQTLVQSLSGGNQQKVVIGKWLNAGVRLLLMDEPTQGIDIQAKAQVYALIRELAATGVGIVFISSELEELFQVCDRILVLNQGHLIANQQVNQITLEQVYALAMREQ